MIELLDIQTEHKRMDKVISEPWELPHSEAFWLAYHQEISEMAAALIVEVDPLVMNKASKDIFNEVCQYFMRFNEFEAMHIGHGGNGGQDNEIHM